MEAASVNAGVLVLRGWEHGDAPRTFVVTGVGRSGTSAVAKVLGCLGVPMGDDGGAVYEDGEFFNALHYFFPVTRARLIEQRNAAHQIWGFKFPSLQNHMHPPELQHFRKPALIVVTRDIVAVTARAMLSDPRMKNMRRALCNISDQQARLTEFALNADCPVLLLSYEKFTGRPIEGVAALERFAGLDVSLDQMHRAVGAITPDNPDYIKLFQEEAAWP